METFFVSILFGVIGLIFGLISLSLIRITFAKQGFESNSATVVSSKVTESYSNNSGVRYGIALLCTYQLNGETFEGPPAVLHYPSRRDSVTLNSVIEEKYPEGKVLKIHVNPSDPSEYVLEKEVKIGDIIPSVVFLIFGGGLLYYALKKVFFL